MSWVCVFEYCVCECAQTHGKKRGAWKRTYTHMHGYFGYIQGAFHATKSFSPCRKCSLCGQFTDLWWMLRKAYSLFKIVCNFQHFVNCFTWISWIPPTHTCWKSHTLFSSDVVVRTSIQLLTNRWKEEQLGSQGKKQLCGMESPPQTYTKQIPKECLIYCVRALLGHIRSLHRAQQDKSISPSCIWRGFYLFWSSLHQAGVKIGVCFSSGLLKVHLISQAHREMVQRKRFNNLSGQTQNQALLK